MGRRTLLLLAALLLAALGTALVWAYVQSADDRARGDNAAVEVYYTTADVTIGQTGAQIQKCCVALQKVSSKLAGGALTSMAPVLDLVATVPIQKGIPLTLAMFASSQKAPAAITIDPKMLAISFALGDAQRVAGFPTQGSLVTIFVTGNPKGGAEAATKTVAVLGHPVKVITIGSAPTQPLARTSAQGTGSSVAQTIVTFELSPDDAATLLTAQSSGALYLGLLNPDVKLAPGVGQPSNPAVTPAQVYKVTP